MAKADDLVKEGYKHFCVNCYIYSKEVKTLSH